MHTVEFIQDLAIIMLIAGAATVLFHRWKQPVVLGYIVAGLIIGPHTPPFALISEFTERARRVISEIIPIAAIVGILFLISALSAASCLQQICSS